LSVSKGFGTINLDYKKEIIEWHIEKNILNTMRAIMDGGLVSVAEKNSENATLKSITSTPNQKEGQIIILTCKPYACPVTEENRPKSIATRLGIL
jgi:hypothetical protein